MHAALIASSPCIAVPPFHSHATILFGGLLSCRNQLSGLDLCSLSRRKRSGPLHVKLEQRRSEHPVGCHELFRRGTFMGEQLHPAKVAEQKALNVPLWQIV